MEGISMKKRAKTGLCEQSPSWNFCNQNIFYGFEELLYSTKYANKLDIHKANLMQTN